MDGTTAAGYNGIQPLVLKLVLLTPYTTGQNDENGKMIYTKPKYGILLLTNMINIILKSKDIPDREKIIIMTLIPKKGPKVCDVTNIRPLSIKTALSRLIKKGLAKRLGSYLDKHKLIDPVQYAFIKGGNIHGPIRAILDIWEDAGRHNKACYNIWYDISRAYDSIKWSSIILSMRRLKIPEDFITFIHNSLQGNKAWIKTGVGEGHTKGFKIEKGIEQGCPIAPLLFIIVMDALHAGYKKFEGYTTTQGECVSSKGYADDAWIVADNINTLRAMNSWTETFMNWHDLDINCSKSIFMGKHDNKTTALEEIKYTNTKGKTEAIQIKKPNEADTLDYT
jgi:hypothetical protein